MILLPLPRFVGPTLEPFFRAAEAGASAARCAANVGNADGRFDKTDSETADRAKEHLCVEPKRPRSAPHACPATVALAHRLPVWGETKVPEPPPVRWEGPCSRFTPYAISFNRSAAWMCL